MSTTALTRRTCTGTRKDGEPCRSTAINADGLCFVHGSSPNLLAEVTRRGGIASGEARREQGKSVRARLREKVEENVELVWAAFRDGLEAVDEEGNADSRGRVAAASALLAEAYGKPAVALVGDPDQPVSFILASAFGAAPLGLAELPETLES